VIDPKAERWLRLYEDEPIHVELLPILMRRSVPQNRRLWVGYTRALRSFSALSGHSKDELHDAIKNTSEVVEPVRLYAPNGDVIGDVRSTRRLSVERFGDYMEETGAKFANWGCDLWPEGKES